jgi:hypothetical protein
MRDTQAVVRLWRPHSHPVAPRQGPVEQWLGRETAPQRGDPASLLWWARAGWPWHTGRGVMVVPLVRVRSM